MGSWSSRRMGNRANTGREGHLNVHMRPIPGPSHAWIEPSNGTTADSGLMYRSHDQHHGMAPAQNALCPGCWWDACGGGGGGGGPPPFAQWRPRSHVTTRSRARGSSTATEQQSATKQHSTPLMIRQQCMATGTLNQLPQHHAQLAHAHPIYQVH